MTTDPPDRAGRIAERLSARFAPLALAVHDESDRHAGHAGARPGGQTHYRVRMVSAAFTGCNRLARARAVHAALEDEFASGLHALTLILAAPDDAPP